MEIAQIETNRSSDLDFVKGFMIILMVCYHINEGYLSKYVGFVYSFHMPVFLLLSGFFTRVSQNTSAWNYKLFRGIIIPYIVFELLYVSCLYLAGIANLNFSNKVNSIGVFSLLSYVFLKPIGAFWYFHTLILSSIITYFVFKLKNINEFSKIILITSIFFGLNYLDFLSFKFENSLFFILGFCFYSQKIEISKSLLAGFAIVLLFIFGDNIRGSISSVATTILSISFLSALYLKISNLKISRLLIFLGKNTLIIVIAHPIFINVFKIFQHRFFLLDPSLISYSILNIAFTIFACLMTGLLMDKFNFSKFFFSKNIYSKL